MHISLKIRKNPAAIFLTLFLPFLFSLFSCSDSQADVVFATANTVFDYKDADSNPSVRLAVFFQLNNEVQRTESFEVYNQESGYSWNVNHPGVFSSLNKNYAYALSLNAPEGESLPRGNYSVKYFDAAGNEDSTDFTVNYKKELLTSTAATCREILGQSTENLAIYDDKEQLLFMGSAKNSWKDNAAILKDYKSACWKRQCFIASSTSVICMMPMEALQESED